MSILTLRGATVIISEELRRNTLSAEQCESLARAKNIVIVDDVAITGKRLQDYLCALRQEYVLDGKHIMFLVGVARPFSLADWTRIQRSCSNHVSFTLQCECVELLALPNWSQAHCPWCREFDLLQNVSARFSRPPPSLLARIGEAASKRHGLSGPPFWLPPGTAEPVLGADALAGPPGMAIVPTVFATASALQNFRHASEASKALAPGFPISYVLDVRRCFTNYSEGLLRAALLRTLQPNEFPKNNAKGNRDFLLGLINQAQPGVLTGEIFLAMARGGLSLPTRSMWDTHLAIYGEDFARHFAFTVGIRD